MLIVFIVCRTMHSEKVWKNCKLFCADCVCGKMSISIEPKIEESCPPIRNVVNTQQSQKRRSEFNFIY